jgi:hypothetical protein
VQNESWATQNYLAALPASFVFVIGTEVFVGSADVNNFLIYVAGRAAKNTSMAAHAVGDVINWIEHDMYLVYGNPSAAAPATDDRKKPMINLSTSTNISWVFDEFASGDGLRTAAWMQSGSGTTEVPR